MLIMEPVDGPDLHAETIELASGPNYAAVTTLLPDGQPQTQVVWIDTDGEHLLINTPARTQKARNAARDPRITVAVWNAANPFQYVEGRGRVTEIRGETEAASHIQHVARKYLGGEYPQPDGRAILVVTPQRQLLARPQMAGTRHHDQFRAWNAAAGRIGMMR